MNKKIMLYVALMAFGLYVMPNTVSIFAGQHSFYNVEGISCEKCHSDVLSQIEHSGYVYEKHKAAAGNTNYTTYLSLGGILYNDNSITDYNNIVWNWNTSERKWQNSSNPTEMVNVSLDTNRNGQIDSSEICMLCHNATLFGATTHTGATVRACDDDRCHGNMKYAYNSPLILGSSSNITAAGYNLSQSNVHQAFYLLASNLSSGYATGLTFGQTPGNVNGSSGFISRGYWTCEGCHTDTNVNIIILPPPSYNHSVSSPEKKRYLP
jgi:hypothetical protein